MNVRIKFLGAAKSVTGSKYLLEIDNKKLLIDCGLFQGSRTLRERNWIEFTTNPEEINAIIVTHAHLDHSGYLPKLVKDGFNGPIYCTEASASLMEILLRDSAKLMKEEAEFARKKGYSRHKDPQPLYTIEDVQRVISLFVTTTYYHPLEIHSNINAQFINAGHILGSSVLKLSITGHTGQVKELVFTGDLGRTNSPLLYPPDEIQFADVLLIESTYGNREMPENVEDEFSKIINKGYDRGGSILIPSFAVGRTQQLLYYLKRLRDLNKIPKIPIYVDSPMAINVTFLYNDYNEYHRLNREEFEHYFQNEDVHYYADQEKSKSLNTITHPSIIISASGMCTGGRIMHHLYHRLRNTNDTLLFVGYQAEETRGRRILDGEKEVSIFGENVPINCHVEQINGLSAHADQSELIDYVNQFKSNPKWTFLVHGESDSLETFQKNLHKTRGIEAIIPEYLESFELFRGI